MRKWLALILAAMMVLSAIPAAMAQEEITLTVYHYAVEGQKADAIEEIEKRFSASVADQITIKWDNHLVSQGGSPNYFDALNSAILGGENVNLMMGNPAVYTDLINEGYVMDLTGNEVIKELGLTDADMGDVSYLGKWYAYPVDFKSWGIFYNVDMFEKNGWEIPKTETELLDLCQKMLDAGISPWADWYADGADVDIQVRIVLWTKAVKEGKLDMFEKLMKGEAKIADYPYFKDAIETWGRRIGAGKGWARNDAMSNDQTGGNEVFISGQAAMLYQGTWNIGTIEQKKAGTDFRYGFFLCPTDDSGETPCLNTQVDQAFMVNPKAANSEWAQKFMEYWLGNEMGYWSDATFQPCITGATTENTVALRKALLTANSSGNTAGYGNFTMSFSSAFINAYRKALNAYAAWACTGTETSGVHDADSCIAYMQELFDEEIAQAGL